MSELHIVNQITKKIESNTSYFGLKTIHVKKLKEEFPAVTFDVLEVGMERSLIKASLPNKTDIHNISTFVKLHNKK